MNTPHLRNDLAGLLTEVEATGVLTSGEDVEHQTSLIDGCNKLIASKFAWVAVASTGVSV